MKIGTDGKNTVEWNIREHHSINNFGVVLGMPGVGKTSFICECVRGAMQDGIPIVVIDFSDSYRKEKDVFLKNKVIYHNVEKKGLGINPFERQMRYIDNIPEPESDDSIAYRVLDVLIHGFKISGSKQRLTLQKKIFNLIEEEGEASSFAYLYASLLGTEIGERIRCLKNLRAYDKQLKWKEILKPGNILVIQLSDTVEHLRYFYTELILNDLWTETKKGGLGEYLLCIDEVQHLRYDETSTMYNMLREARKYSVAMLVATQFIGNMKNKDGRLALEHAAQKFYFVQNEKNINAVAKSIDESNYLQWKNSLRNLQVGEFIFVGNGMIDKKAYNLRCRLKFDIST